MMQLELFPQSKPSLETRAGQFFGLIMSLVFGLGLTCLVTGAAVGLACISLLIAAAPMYAFVYCWNTWLAGCAKMAPFVSTRTGLGVMVLLTFLYMTFNALFLPKRS